MTMTGTTMKLIEKTDPLYFTQTSDAIYDRQWYKIHCTDKSVKVVESWEEAMTAFWNYKHFISHIEVIDAKRRNNVLGFQ